MENQELIAKWNKNLKRRKKRAGKNRLTIKENYELMQEETSE